MNNFIKTKEIFLDLINLLEPIEQTLGPNGNTIFINNFSTVLTKDGATVLKNIHTDNPYLLGILNFIKDNINILSQNIGDGTTTTIILIRSLLKAIYPWLDYYNSREIIKNLNNLQNQSNQIIKQLTKPINLEDHFLTDLANISVNGDENLSKIIVSTIQKVGPDGLINIEKIFTNNDEILGEYFEGINLNIGYSNQYFLSNNLEKNIKLEHPLVLFSNQRLTLMNESMQYIINYAIENQRPLVIMALEIEGDLLNHLIVAHNRNLLKCCTIKVPYNYQEFTKDLAFVTKGKLWDNKILEESLEIHLGSCDSMEITQNNTTIINPSQDKNLTEKYINNLKDQLHQLEKVNVHNSYEKVILSQRINKLQMTMAIIKIGGTNEANKEEIKDRLTDGIASVRWALKEGIVPGGGITLFLINKFMEKNNDLMNLFGKSLLDILKIIINHSIHQNSHIIINKIDEFYKYKDLPTVVNNFQNNNDILLAFNGYNYKLVNLLADGIINAQVVEKFSLNTAINIVKNIINSPYIINNN
jgi:chaperonin GroEL